MKSMRILFGVAGVMLSMVACVQKNDVSEVKKTIHSDEAAPTPTATPISAPSTDDKVTIVIPGLPKTDFLLSQETLEDFNVIYNPQNLDITMAPVLPVRSADKVIAGNDTDIIDASDFDGAVWDNTNRPKEGKVKANGQEIDAINIGYYAGTDIVSDFEVKEPTTFTFARDNKFIARQVVYMDKEGHITLVVVPKDSEKIEWKTTQGDSMKFECGRYALQFGAKKGVAQPNPGGVAVNHVVTFHPNGEYASGCAVSEDYKYEDKHNRKFEISGLLEMDENFELLRAQIVKNGQIKVNGKTVKLHDGSIVEFFENSFRPQSFTMEKAESYEGLGMGYGVLKCVQYGKHDGLDYLPNELTPEGHIKNAVIDQALVHKQMNWPIPRGSLIGFGDDDVLIGMGYPDDNPQEFKVKSGNFLAKTLVWDNQKGYYTMRMGRAFTFTDPNKGDKIEVPVTSVVGFDKDWNIVGILTPSAAPKTHP